MSTSLWIYLIPLALMAGLFVLLPVLRFRPPRSEVAGNRLRREKNVEVFKQEIRDLEEQQTQGLISADECESLKIELERALIRDVESLSQREDKAAGISAQRIFPLGMSLLFLIVAFVLYETVGSRQDLGLPMLVQEARNAEGEEQFQALQALADFLQLRYERHQDDMQNAYMLGTLNLELEHYDQAAATFESMLDQIEAVGDRATVMGQLAQAQYLAADRQITEQVRTTLNAAFELNPNEYSSLSLLAVDAFSRQDFVAALGYWQRQLTQLEAGTQEYRVMQERVERLRQLLPEQALAAAGQAPTSESEVNVRVRVEVPDEILSRLDPKQRVFVYARGTAMPMPLAAKDFTVADLPLEISLDDSMAMMPQMTLSSTERAFVGARISFSGSATPSSGDYQVESDVFAVSEQEDVILLRIEEQVP